MTSLERKHEILRLLERQGYVEVGELARRCAVSDVTIRRDLSDLMEEGLLVRTHGGAKLRGANAAEPPYFLKEIQHVEVKEAIGRRAAQLVSDGDAIILNAGTTAHALAKELKSRKRLQVLTNAIPVAAELADCEDIQVVLTGGVLREKTLALVGPVAERTIAEVYVRWAFLGVNGISMERGIAMYSQIEAHVNKAFIRAAQEVVVVADSSKFTTAALSVIAPITAVHWIITDDGLAPELREACEARGIKVLTVERGVPDAPTRPAGPAAQPSSTGLGSLS
jgi:DeoR/GlpR family transcriptional regulator of sugar metabolism